MSLAVTADMAQDYGYVAVGVAMILESTIGVGIVVPGLTILVGAGVLAGSGKLAVELLWPIAYVAVVIGDLAGYALGRFGTLRSTRIANASKRLNRMIRLDRVAWWWFFFHFPVVTRTVFPIAVGASRVRFITWLMVSCGAAALFVTTFLGLGVAVGRVAGDIGGAKRASEVIEIGFLVILGLAIAWVVGRRLRAASAALGHDSARSHRSIDTEDEDCAT